MIEPKYQTLRTLFSDRVFRIPHYQRFYDWERPQREDLFSDITALAARPGHDHHFMATIVCFRTSEVKPVGANEYYLYDVVDGQQRLTTLIILLKVIALRLDPGQDQNELDQTLRKGDGHLILLQSNNANEHLFNSFIRTGTEPDPERLSTVADRKLAYAIRHSSEFVDQWKNDNGDLVELLKLVRNRLGFVVYDTEDPRAVYTLFEVLNSRGLAVDWLDKCKSMLMGRAYEASGSDASATAAIDRLQNIWAGIYRDLASASIHGETVLRSAATLIAGPYRGKPRPPDTSLEVLRERATTADATCEIAEQIADVARKLVKLEQNKYLGPATKVLQSRILAVALMSATFLDEQERRKVLQKWENVTFRIFGLCRNDARFKVGEYIRLATAILNKQPGASRYSEVMTALRDLGKDHPVESSVEDGLSGIDLYDFSPPICRYILWRYEESLASTPAATVDEHERNEIWRRRAVESIEHIYPQTPEAGGYWDGKLADAEGREEPAKHIGRIGNLILLPQPLNEEASRKPFPQKKSAYSGHNLRMINEIRSEEDWTLDQIEEREKRIIEWAKREWSDVPV